MAIQCHTKLLLTLLISAGLLAGCSAGSAVPDYGYDQSHSSSSSSSTGELHAWDMDYNTLPRKAVIHKDTANADKVAVLKVTVTLNEDHTSCPSTHNDMDGLRQYIAEAFDTMLRRAHVDAKIKIGTLGCQANVEKDCVKVVLQFVVKLHSKKASDQLPRFVNVVTTAPYSHKPICDIQELECHAHDVACIEVEQLSRKPHGTMLHKYVPADAEVDVDGEQDDSTFAGHSSWTRKSHHGKKHKHSKSDETGSELTAGTDNVTDAANNATDGDESTSDEDGTTNYGSDAYGVKISSVRKAGVATTSPAPALELDTRIWPDETVLAGAATAPTAPARVKSAFVKAASAIAAAARATSSAAAAANAKAAAAAASSAADTAKAAAAQAAVAAAAAASAAEPQQLGPSPFDIRLWPLMPSIRAAAPLQ